MITRYKIFKENLLKPTSSIEDKLLKVRTINKQLLMDNEELDFHDLENLLDETWDFDLDSKLIKTKKIIGDVVLDLNHIPSWITNIEIDGSFDCSNCNLTSLENCPKIIHGTFSCSFNNLTSLDEGPTFVSFNYFCKKNSVIFTEKYVKSICKVLSQIYV